MSSENLFTFSVATEAKVEVERESLDKSRKILDDFYNEYSDKQIDIGVDNKALKQNISNANKAVAGFITNTRKYMKEYRSIASEPASWLNADQMKDDFASVIPVAKEFLKDVRVVFNDGTELLGFDEIFKELEDGVTQFEQHLAAGIKSVDLGGQLDKIKQDAADVFDTLKALFDYRYHHDGSLVYDFDNFNQDSLSEAIKLLTKLAQLQNAISIFSGKELKSEDFASKDDADYLARQAKKMQENLDLMRTYRLQTVEELNKRKEIENAINSWQDPIDMDDAMEQIDNQEVYEKNLQVLQYYIEKRRELLEILSEEPNLVRYDADGSFVGEDGINEYRERLESQLSDAITSMEQLQEAKVKLFKNSDPGTTNINLTEVVEALGEIKQAIIDVADAFKPLTDALGNEESAINAMVTSNVAQLDELVNKFKEVHEMINQLNQKDFSIQQNVYNQTVTKEDPLAKFRETKKEAKALYDEVYELWELSAAFNKESKKDRGTAVYFEDTFGKTYTEGASTIGGFALQLGRLNQVVTKGKADEIESAIIEMNKFKEVIIQFLEIQNQIQPGSFDASKYTAKTSAAAKDASDAIEKTKSITESTSNNIQDDTQKLEEVRTKITTISGQILEELTSIRAQIENTFDFSTINPDFENIKSITDQIYQQFVELQSKIKALDFKIEVPTDGIAQITQVIAQEGNAAQEATPKKNAFTEANKKVAASMQDTGEAGNVAVEGIKAEETAVESMASTMDKSANKIIASQEEIENKYKTAFGGSGKISKNLAAIFNQELATAGIDVSSINAAFNQKSETVGKGDDKQVITYDTIKLIAQGTDALGKATTVTREYEVATGALIKQMGGFKDVKDTFDIKKETETANSKVAELEKRMGSFKIDLEDVKEAAKNITDQTSLDIFEKALEAANQQLKEIKASLKSSHSLDPIVNAESMMSTLPATIAKYRESIKQFANVEGFDKLESSLDVIETKLKEFEANQAFGGNGIDMASIVADINKEITTYNANLGLITERYKANTRAANEAVKAEKQRIIEQNAAEKKAAQQSKFELDLNRQTGLLTKQQARWEAMGILTDELKEKINSMFDALAQVTDSNGLSAWKTQWEMVKDQVAETQLRIEAANKAQNEKASERKAARAYWDEEFNYSLNNLITPEKRPELEQLKVSMLRQAEMTKESVMEQYDAIMTIISNKNKALSKLMSSKGPEEQKYWQDQYSSWFGAWNALDPNTVSSFFEEVGNQAILGAKNVEKFNAALEESKQLAAKQQDKALKAQEDAQAQAAKLSAKATKESTKKQNFNLDLERQISLLTKQQAQWEKNGQLTDDLRLNIELMFEALTEVTNSSELSAWKKQWAIVKDEVMATKYQIDAVNKAQKESDSKKAEQEGAKSAEREASRTYWDSAFKESVSNLITPKKRPELEQLKAYMLAQAEQTKESVMEQYEAIFAIISNKNIALQKLMAAKGPSEKQYWQDEYSAWFGAWNNLDQNVVSNFFKDAGNQAILGKDKVEAFNNELEKSTQLANKQKDAEFNKQAKEQEKINKKNQNYGKTEYNKYAKFYENMNATIRNIEQNGSINQYLDGLVQKYTEAYKKIEAMRKQFAENPDAANDIGLKNDFQDAVVEAEKLRKEITGVFNEAKKFDQVDRIGEVFTLDQFNFDDIKSSLIAFANEVTNGKVKLEGFNDAGTQLYGTLDNGSGSIEKVTFALREGTNQLYAYSAATGKAANEWEDFKAKAIAGAKNLIGMYVGFQEGVQAFRTGVNYVKEIDLAMTELKKVTDETDASYKQFLKDAASTSSIIGSTISDFTEATANFARLNI